MKKVMRALAAAAFFGMMAAAVVNAQVGCAADEVAPIKPEAPRTPGGQSNMTAPQRPVVSHPPQTPPQASASAAAATPPAEIDPELMPATKSGRFIMPQQQNAAPQQQQQ